MGILEDIIQTIGEAMAEAQTQGKRRASDAPPQPPGEPHPYDLIKAQKRIQQQAAEKPPSPTSAPHKSQEKTKHAPAPQVVDHRARLARLLHQPQTLKELMLLKEILDKPLALRRRHFP